MNSNDLAKDLSEPEFSHHAGSAGFYTVPLFPVSITEYWGNNAAN